MDSTNSWICDGGRVYCSSLGKVIFCFLFLLCHSNLDFFVIFMFKYDFIDNFLLHIPLWSAENV